MGTTGVVLGKFLPFHRGHRFLVERAAAACDELFVLVMGSSAEEAIIPLATREAWVRELVGSPRVHVRARITDGPMSWTDPAIIAFWNRVILEMVGRPSVDVLFTSEGDTYGDVTAAGIGARHVCVDPGRAAVPISGTAIRRDPLAAWAYLDPPVRAFYARRVRVIGGESTGKTTLTDLLARRFETAWVPEFGRAYSDPKDARGETWTTADFVAIATRQGDLEDVVARRADRVLFADTDALTTGIWHRVYLGARDAGVDAIGATRPYALTLVAGTDIGWVQDGDRRSPHERALQQAELTARLDELGAPWLLVTGSRRERVAVASAAVEAATGTAAPAGGLDWLELGLEGRWRHLVPGGRHGLRVRPGGPDAIEVAASLDRERTDYATLGSALALQPAAVREADWYAARHVELAYAVARSDDERVAANAGPAT